MCLKMILLIIFLAIQIWQSVEEDFYYDEDISLPVPEVILNHSPINEPAPKFLTWIHNCKCREYPEEYVCCFGQHCQNFPASLNMTAPLFKLKLSAVAVLKRNDLQLFGHLKYLEIESNTLLEYIEPGVFRNMTDLLNLTISFNPNLRYLEWNTFEGLVKLGTLSMQNNGFMKIIDVSIALQIKYVPNLFLLRLDENVFSDVQAHEFQPMNGSKLQQLNLVMCQIEYIHPNTLQPFKYLTSLRLGQNHFNSSVMAELIEKSTEHRVPLDNLNLFGMGLRKKPPLDLLTAIGKSHIRFLHLTNDHFDQLDGFSFPYMPNLIKISLRGDHIADMDPNTFKNIPKLQMLWLTANRLLRVPESVLLGSLRQLDLAGNTLNLVYSSYFYIPDEIFKNMNHLEHLSLAYNNICYLTNLSFVGLSNLTRLNLKNTSVSSIESGTFSPLINLNLLNLKNNPDLGYAPLKADIFKGLTNLEVLLLGGCLIKNLTVSPSLFTHTNNLKYLGLQRNNLFQIGTQQFGPLTKLQYLNLDDNLLPVWNKRIFSENSTLKTFSAVSNKFNLITSAMLEDWATLENLYLDGNPFTCDCSLYSVVLWYRNNPSVIKIHRNRENIAACIAPTYWRHKSITSFLAALNSDKNFCETNCFSTEIIIALIVLLCLLLTILICSYLFKNNLEYLLFSLQLLPKKKHTESYKYDVYVSYCQKDEWFLPKLIEKLEPELKLCIAERDLTIGDTKPSAVAEAVSSCRLPLLLVSEEYFKSSWARWETQLVARKSPIAVQLETVDAKNAPPLLRYLLKTRIYIVWPQEDDKTSREIFWQKLKAALLR